MHVVLMINDKRKLNLFSMMTGAQFGLIRSRDGSHAQMDCTSGQIIYQNR